jgi:isopenicillin N synthase-like dioxygenase
MSNLTAPTLDAPVPTAAAPALPVIDLQALRDPATQPQALRQLARTARDTGFFYLEGHGIAREAWQGIQRRAREFFAQPLADKQALAIANTRHFRGYTGVGMEITRQRPDQREQIDLGEESPEIPAGPGVPDW